MSQQRSRVVFVGNLPFDVTEEQLVDVFQSVGPVVSFRLVFDHATGKPKGFGFCEYKDPETAASALRNLQGVEVGGRGLRLDFADTDNAGVKRGGAPERGGGGGGGGRDARDAGRGGGGGGGGYDGGSRRDVGPPPKPLPLGVPLQDGTSATDSISQTLATMPPGQLLDIMSQMKVLVTTSPFEARTLLASNPQLTYALFQAMLMMNIVDASILQKMLGSGVGAVKQEPYAQQPPPQAAYSNSYSSRPPPPTQQSNYPSYSTPPPAPVSQNYQQIQQQQQQQQRAPAPVAPPQDQAALIAQVLGMTQQQVDALPPDHRETIMKIRTQAAATMGRR